MLGLKLLGRRKKTQQEQVESFEKAQDMLQSNVDLVLKITNKYGSQVSDWPVAAIAEFVREIEQIVRG